MPSIAPPRPSATWAPHAGSQALFLSCPIFETLYEGTRGPGKTDALLMDFAQHTGQGYGEYWRGILFRRTYKQLSDVVAKSQRWFKQIFPRARFNRSDYVWTFPDGEELLLRYMDTPDDYWNYHGHEYPWIGFEELTNWATSQCYNVMKSCSRSTRAGMPRKYRSTCNPYGKGHNWVKFYFVDPAPAGVPFVAPALELPEGIAPPPVEGGEQLLAVRLTGHYTENRTLLEADPTYPQKIAASASNPEQAKAWLHGSWDIVAGGMFDDVWRPTIHVLQGNDAWTPAATPSSWRIDRSYDWGSSKPFSVGWWAESDGTQAPNGRIYPRGTLIRIAEWYGWNGQPNVGLRMTDDAIATEIASREKQMGIAGRVRPGPADTMIFSADPGRQTAADIMAAKGVRFSEADKKPGSRIGGWNRMRQLLKAAADGNRELPWLLVMDTCRQFIRTVPTLPRSDKDPDDVDTEAEDHIADETRYRVMAPKTEAGTLEWRV